MVDTVMAPSAGANCVDDVDNFLLGLDTLQTNRTKNQELPPPALPLTAYETVLQQLPESVQSLVSVSAIPELQVNSDNLSFTEKNILSYIAGYIIRKIRMSVCDMCLGSMITTEHLEHNSFIDVKRFVDAKDGLITPSTKLLQVLCSIEGEYRRIIDTAMYSTNVKACLSHHLGPKTNLDSIRCENCNVHRMVLHIMINIRLHHTLKETNRSLIASKDRKNRKVLKFSHL